MTVDILPKSQSHAEKNEFEECILALYPPVCIDAGPGADGDVWSILWADRANSTGSAIAKGLALSHAPVAVPLHRNATGTRAPTNELFEMVASGKIKINVNQHFRASKVEHTKRRNRVLRPEQQSLPSSASKEEHHDKVGHRFIKTRPAGWAFFAGYT